MSQPETIYPVAKTTVSAGEAKKYKVWRVGINWGDDGVHSVGTIESSLEDAFKAIELILQGHDVEAFYLDQEELLLGVHQDDKASLNEVYVIKEGDIPVAFYQGGRWFLPDNTTEQLKSMLPNEALEMTTTTETANEAAALQRGYYEFPQYESLLIIERLVDTDWDPRLNQNGGIE